MDTSPEDRDIEASARRSRSLGTARTPIWKTVFNAIEVRATPRVDAALQSEALARIVVVGVRIEAGARRRIEGMQRSYWRLLNLPSGTDVARMSNRLSHLERQITDLRDTHRKDAPP